MIFERVFFTAGCCLLAGRRQSFLRAVLFGDKSLFWGMFLHNSAVRKNSCINPVKVYEEYCKGHIFFC